ncbi:MAG: LPS export ABC transporter periplasmic protein LptC [Betaproteobacteria bacterium]|nr:LPS export ABC transporter periplasmic protein LptC [Betaproteobacteria bacterium]NBY33827.1 LPS export ABC transporter periplasmic protein LptC [Betaproteobacteria bacterium]
MNSLPRLPAPVPTSGWRKRLETLLAFLPMVLLAILLWGSVWLVRNAPKAVSGAVVAETSHEPDYFANNFTLKTYSLQGDLKSFLQGTSSVHFPDTLTNLIEQPVVHSISRSGRLTTAVAQRSLSNEDGSEIQLIGQAVVHKQGVGTKEPAMTLRSEFIHMFTNTDTLVTYAPVKIERGDNRFQANGMKADNLNQRFLLQGQVKVLLVPGNRP